MKIHNLIVLLLLCLSYTQALPAEEKKCTLTPMQTKIFSSEKRNVVDYYRTLVACQLVSDYYELHYIDDRWTNGEAGDLYSVVVDIDHGFIQFDEESGDAYETSQIALFRDKNRDALIAYYDELRVGAYFGYKYADLSFYRLDQTNRQIVNVTEEVLPQITLSDFGISDIEYKNLKNIKQELFSSAIENTILFSYKLPRYGTSVQAILVVNKSQLDHYRQYITDHSDLEILDHYYNQISKETIELKWDKAKSRFVREQ
jgi:hypothetical protein